MFIFQTDSFLEDKRRPLPFRIDIEELPAFMLGCVQKCCVLVRALGTPVTGRQDC